MSGELFAREKALHWKLLRPRSDDKGVVLTTLEDIASAKTGSGGFSREGWEVFAADLSPDMAKLAVLVRPWLGRRGVNEGLYVADSDGANVQLLTDEFHVVGGLGTGISWSPDGKKIAFVGASKEKYSANEYWALKPPRPQGLHLIDLENKKIETPIDGGINKVYTQAWSSDSKAILFVDAQKDINIYNLDSKSSRRLAKGADYPSWSRDG